MNMFKLDILLPDKKLYTGSVPYLIAPGEEGDLGILVNHMPLIAKLRQGKITIQSYKNEPEISFDIKGGYLEMANNHCVILAEAY